MNYTVKFKIVARGSGPLVERQFSKVVTSPCLPGKGDRFHFCDFNKEVGGIHWVKSTNTRDTWTPIVWLHGEWFEDHDCYEKTEAFTQQLLDAGWHQSE